MVDAVRTGGSAVVGEQDAVHDLAKQLEQLTLPPLSVLAFGEAEHAPEKRRPGDPKPVCVVYADYSREVTAGLQEPLRQAWLRSRVEPLLLRASEVSRMADVFPIKVLELRDRSRLLVGENPFSHVRVDREHLRLRLEQETRNHELRMRRQLVMAATDALQLGRALLTSCTLLAQELATLLVLKKPTEPSFANLPDAAEVRRQAQEMFGFDAELLLELARFRTERNTDDVRSLFERHLPLLDGLAAAADRLEPQSS